MFLTCKNIGSQNKTKPIFEPKASKSYKLLFAKIKKQEKFVKENL